MAKPDGAALVTGASGGIGLELARLLARGGHDLVLVARSAEKLQTLARELEGEHGVRAHALPADLTDPGAPERIAAELRGRGVEVEVLVNNAGFGVAAPFAEADTARQVEMIQVNVTALTHLTRLFLPAMLSRRSGRILNVASTAAFQPGPFLAVYYATKAYVLSFSEAVAEEVRGTGVTVTALCPGPTHTGFAAEARMEGTLLFRAGRVMDAATVARVGYRGMMRGKRLVIPGVLNQVVATVAQRSPRALVLRLVRQLNRVPGT